MKSPQCGGLFLFRKGGGGLRRIDFLITPDEDGMKVEHYLKTVRKMSSRVIISLKHRPEGLQLNGEHIRTIDRIHAGNSSQYQELYRRQIP